MATHIGSAAPLRSGVMAGETLSALTARLGTSPTGLPASEAGRRYMALGPNDLSAARQWSTIREAVRSAASPLVVILLVAGAASAFLRETTDAVIIGAIVLLSSGLNFWQTARSERAVKRLQARCMTFSPSSRCYTSSISESGGALTLPHAGVPRAFAMWHLCRPAQRVWALATFGAFAA